MFEKLEMAPPDPILGLTEAYNKDSNPEKINLGVGVYKDASGKTPVLECVKAAEARILEEESSKGYLPMSGSPDYGAAVQQLVFGANSNVVSAGRAATAHTPGGTGALRVAGDFMRQQRPNRKIWLPDPTWANHQGIFAAAGLPTETYAYFDAASNSVDFAAMTASLTAIPGGDVVLLHVCCHNPAGADLSAEQWNVVADIVAERELLPLLDFAYQGFADGLEEDAVGATIMARPDAELLLCSSFSKNFSLYNERTGALTVIAADADAVEKVMSHVKLTIRTNYSNPPAHGAKIVTGIVNDPDLRSQWLVELKDMRDRINGMRSLFVDTLAGIGVEKDFSFIKHQRGMFSFSGLNKDQVQALRNDNAIYIVGSGRINVAGMTEDNMDRLCNAIKAVL
jgi:aspartate/tyrosine/aromatic aminotransferase